MALSSTKLNVAAAMLFLASVAFFVAGVGLIAASVMTSSNASDDADPGVDRPTDEIDESEDVTPPPAKKPGLLARLFGGGAGAERPRFDGKRPIGLYLMTKFWIATNHLEKATWYFTDDGRVYLNPEGITEEELASHKGAQGRVRVEGNDLVVMWSDGKESRNEIEIDGDGFAWDTGIYAPVQPFDDASQLAGRWDGGTSMSFGGGYAAAAQTLEINADGTFRRDATASFRNESDESVATAGSTGSSAGTWHLDGYTLTLTFGDGKTQRGVCFPFDDEKTPIYPDRFYFGQILFKKLS